MLRPLSNPPSPQRQGLQLQRRRLNEPPECHHAHNHTHDIHHIISIPANIAYPSTLYTPFFSRGSSTGEGVCDERAFEFRGEGVGCVGRDAGGDCEGVDKLEDEEAGESTA